MSKSKSKLKPKSKKEQKKTERRLKREKRKRNRSAAVKRARRLRRKTHMIVFLNGKQKWVPRPQLIDGMPVDEYIARNADPIWLHQNELWELMAPEDEPPMCDTAHELRVYLSS
jgi:hypothetical protein